MKTLITFIFSLSLFTASANDEKYVAAMSKNINAVYNAQTIEEFQHLVNTFDRIGQAEKTKWEPFYYAAFGNVMIATRTQEGAKKDGFLDLAKQSLDKANALQPNDSEIIALEGFIHMIRVTVDPASRGQQYSMMAMQSFSKAVELNPANPRALSLLAQMQFGTARFFNQEPTEACATAAKAQQLFSEAAPSTNPLAPAWGKKMTEGLVAKCGGQ